MILIKSYRPRTLENALQLMNQQTLIPLAGGTDLMIRSRNWQGAARNFKQNVVLIAHLKELKGIMEDADAFFIGAGTTQTEIVDSEILPGYFKEVVSAMATPAIRNAATIGGNIVNAASVADTLPPLYAMDARVVLTSITGERVLPVADFILGKYKTARNDNELLTQIILPKYNVQSYTYKKMGQRRASILSKVSFLAVCGENDVRIAIGALNDTVLRSRAIEEIIVSGRSAKEIITAYQSLYESHDDKRSTKAYKETVVTNILKSWLEEKSYGQNETG